MLIHSKTSGNSDGCLRAEIRFYLLVKKIGIAAKHSRSNAKPNTQQQENQSLVSINDD